MHCFHEILRSCYITQREESYQACGLVKAIELTITTHVLIFAVCACEQFVIPIESKLQKRSNRRYTRSITKAHNGWRSPSLCLCNTTSNSEKKRRNGGEPPTPIAMSLTTTLSGR